jgi:uncharacterized protein
MSAFDDQLFSPQDFSGKARLFPLPNLVLFPHVMQPLHIFELRYRDLLEDALAGDRLIATVLLAPGWEKTYQGTPAICATACLGRIATHVRLADGTHNVLLLGLQRAKLVREVQPVHRFREAQVELCADRYGACPEAHQNALRQQLHDRLLEFLPIVPKAQEQLDQLLGSDVPLGVLTDVVSYMLDLDLAQKQLLLDEVDVYRRAEVLVAHLAEATAALAAGHSAVDFPPEFSAN